MRYDRHHPATSPALDQYPLCAHNILSYSLPPVAEEIGSSRCPTICYVNLPPHKSGGKWVVNGGQRGGIREVNGSVLGVNRPQTNRPRAKTSHPPPLSAPPAVPPSSFPLRHAFVIVTFVIGHSLVIAHFRFVMATTTLCYPLAIRIVTTQAAGKLRAKTERTDMPVVESAWRHYHAGASV